MHSFKTSVNIFVAYYILPVKRSQAIYVLIFITEGLWSHFPFNNSEVDRIFKLFVLDL